MYNVYLICANNYGEKLYKIGITKRDVNKRLRELKTGNAGEMFIVDKFHSRFGSKIERRLHSIYKDKRVNREWFELEPEDLEKFIENCQNYHNIFCAIN